MNAYPNPKLPNFIQIWIYRFSGQMGPFWSAAWPRALRRPENATQQFPCWGEALPLCKSALSSLETCLKWSLVEIVKLPGGFQHWCPDHHRKCSFSSPLCGECYHQQGKARCSVTLPCSCGIQTCSQINLQEITNSHSLSVKNVTSSVQTVPGACGKQTPQAKLSPVNQSFTHVKICVDIWFEKSNLWTLLLPFPLHFPFTVISLPALKSLKSDTSMKLVHFQDLDGV